MGKFDAFQQKMQEAGLNQAAIDAFRLNYEQLEQGVTGLVRYHIASCACGHIHCASETILHRRCAQRAVEPSALHMRHLLLKSQSAFKEPTGHPQQPSMMVCRTAAALHGWCHAAGGVQPGIHQHLKAPVV